MPLYLFSLILYYLLAQKNGNLKMAQGCRLSYKRYEYSLEKLYKKKIIGETSLCQYA